ncbi:hypothetical protein M9979_03630 [Sphingomonas sp. RP10(2022)]|uniref:Sugar transporter n=1 Tax=Sphingomonas liriopis TaxID=2949094 RepID=A0A9X2HXP4_9SPHN|nr:hypothetical protein [Sphingomonas liriopis]MCP3733965.1 hypothetical protein [Sphingomonas liriopis]
MTQSDRRPPAWFGIVAVVLVIWGAVGVFACVQQLRLGAEAMGPADAYYRRLYATLPFWYNPVYAVATFSGLAAALALALRSRFAGPLFAVSLVAIVIQFGWLFAATDLIAVRGAAQVVPFPVFIAAVAAFGLWLSRHARRQGWIG